MKNKDKERLQADLIKYSEQIGISEEERPKLILDRKEYSKLKIKTHDKIDVGYNIASCILFSCKHCNYEARIIYINGSTRTYTIRRYLTPRGQKRTGIKYHYKIVKFTPRYQLNCLVHELVHYRFQSMPHGLKFENRIKEILKGQTFPKVELFSSDKE